MTKHQKSDSVTSLVAIDRQIQGIGDVDITLPYIVEEHMG